MSQVSLQSLLALVPLPVLLSLVTSVAIPYLSALVTRRPNWYTGAVTIVLSLASAFLAQWALASGHFDWKAALSNTILNWAVAALSHSKWLKGTPLEDWLQSQLGGDGAYDISTLPPAVPVQNAPAGNPVLEPAVGALPPPDSPADDAPSPDAPAGRHEAP